MDMPPVKKFLGFLPLKYGCFLISLFGFSLGALMLAGIIIYGIAEHLVMSYFPSYVIDEDVKKVVLLPTGLSSLLLLLANALLLLGVTFKRETNVGLGARILLFMCVLLLLIAIACPVSCFFLPSLCVIKRMMIYSVICMYLILTLFVDMWLYCSTVCWNLQQTMVK
ncbi:uncharacterized protein LOC106130515 [Amyelois transitella]|uniref:uncharacterized protein LOC106130515 n=1 Tax=Amyelois transitella TaxID=680683 RepID=UPI0029901379|nr:uncharacterized protein LOC106130515 [Amyelois transitella]